MDPLTSTAASGLRARMESLDLLANNLANSETAGYKSDREFYTLYAAAEGADGEPAATMPEVSGAWTDFSQGTLRATGNPLDLALAGKGFFTVSGPRGPLYTRHGGFQISHAGLLTTTEGYPVRLADGGELRVEPGAPLEVAVDGTVRQQSQALGKLELVNFADASRLSKQGNNYFRVSDPSAASAPAAVEVQQGKLEHSNVATAESAVRLVGILRQFEMLNKAISIGADMNRKAIEDVARVGS